MKSLDLYHNNIVWMYYMMLKSYSIWFSVVEDCFYKRILSADPDEMQFLAFHLGQDYSCQVIV